MIDIKEVVAELRSKSERLNKERAGLYALYGESMHRLGQTDNQTIAYRQKIDRLTNEIKGIDNATCEVERLV